ncbi:MAG: DUF4476 domain-containing protein [Polyangia bacterium]
MRLARLVVFLCCSVAATFAAPRLARADSTLVVAADVQSVWHGFVVVLDGTMRSNATHDAKRIHGVGAGRHEIAVNLITNPFKPNGTPMCKGFVDVPPESELRIKCEAGQIIVIGATAYDPPPPAFPSVPLPPFPLPPQVDPSSDAADSLLAQAQQLMGDGPPACARLGEIVRVLRDDLAERRHGRHGRHRLADETNAVADQARDVCTRPAVDSLRAAALELRPFGAPPPPPIGGPASVDSQQLNTMRIAIESQAQGAARLQMMRRVTSGQFFATWQVATLLRVLPHGAARLLALREIAGRIIDPANAQPLYDCFASDAERMQVQQILSR